MSKTVFSGFGLSVIHESEVWICFWAYVYILLSLPLGKSILYNSELHLYELCFHINNDSVVMEACCVCWLNVVSGCRWSCVVVCRRGPSHVQPPVRYRQNIQHTVTRHQSCRHRWSARLHHSPWTAAVWVTTVLTTVRNKWKPRTTWSLLFVKCVVRGLSGTFSWKSMGGFI